MAIKTPRLSIDELVASQVALWEVEQKLHGKSPRQQKPQPWERGHITISRPYGAKGYEIAKIVGKTLNWSVYGKNLVQYIAETTNVRQKVIESFDETVTNNIQHWVKSFLDSKAMGPDQYLRHLISVLISIEEHGRAVIVGRGANYVLKHEAGLHVRVDAPFDWRVKQIAAKYKIGRIEAQRIVRQHDSDREAFIKRYFQSNCSDPNDYDLTINISTMDVNKAAELIIKAMEIKYGIPRPEPDMSYEAIIPDDDV